jgi:RNA:NAD 2'-phosphotransferase (TPT1/KptA family)
VTDVTARYLLEQAAKGRWVDDAMVAEADLAEDEERFVVNQINSINQIRAAAGVDGAGLAAGVA